jgi:hypothetical protein
VIADESQLRQQIASQNDWLFRSNGVFGVQEGRDGVDGEAWGLGLKNFTRQDRIAGPADSTSKSEDNIPQSRRALTKEDAQELNRQLMEQSQADDSKQAAPTPARSLGRGERESQARSGPAEPPSSREREFDGSAPAEWPQDAPALAGRRGGGFGGGGLGGGSEGMFAGDRWSAAGGLSVDFAIPEEGQKLVFTKIGGDPALALRALPRRSMETGLGLAWTAVWLTLGVGAFVAINRTGRVATIGRLVPAGLTVLGVLGFFLLPAPASSLAFAVFAAGAALVAWQRGRGEREA